jgi:tetrahydromethanopterin S-methyltransferase subunit A
LTRAPYLGNLQEETMRRFMGHFVTEIDFVDGDEASDAAAKNYQKHLAETVQDAAQNLPLRTIKGARVERVGVEEIKAEGL